MEFEGEKRTEEVMKELRAYFKPEFLNRLDDIIIFNPLSEDGLRELWALCSKTSRKNCYPKRLKLSWVLRQKAIAEAGFDPVYGSTIERALYELVEDTLAELILEEKLHEGEYYDWRERWREIVINKI